MRWRVAGGRSARWRGRQEGGQGILRVDGVGQSGRPPWGGDEVCGAGV